MKNTVKITRRFVSLFLVLVASSIIFLASPAIAATSSWVFLNPDSNPSDLRELQAPNNKPTIMLFVPQELEAIKELDDEDIKNMMDKTFLGDTKPEAEKFFGDKYKYVSIPIETNIEFYKKTKRSNYPGLIPLIAASKNGKILGGFFVTKNSIIGAFELLENELKSLEEEDKNSTN